MVIHYGIDDKYDEYSCCPVCNGDNEFSEEYYIEHKLMEVNTKCKKCGHKNYWIHGVFTEKYVEDILQKKLEGDEK